MWPNKINEIYLKPDDNFYQEIVPNVWLMDNHKWAYYIWELKRSIFNDKIAAIIHIDYHWDAGDDFYSYPEKLKEFKQADISEIQKLVKEGHWIQFDSFICPALIRVLSDEVHFVCYQESGDKGIYKDSLESYGSSQYFYGTSADLKKYQFTKPLIFDFCIDVFNRSDNYYEGNIWPDKEINDFLEGCKSLVKQASIITVSMSYGYSGTKDDTDRLTKLVMSKFLEWREN